MPDETINYRFTGSADFSDAEASISALEQRMQQAFEGLSRVPSSDFPSSGGSPWRNELGQFAAPMMGVEAASMATADPGSGVDIGGLREAYGGMGGGFRGQLQLGELEPEQSAYIKRYLEGAAETGAGFGEMSGQLSRYLGWETGAWGARVPHSRPIPTLSEGQFDTLAQYVGAEGAGGAAGGGGGVDVLGALQMMAGGGAGGIAGGGLQLAGVGGMGIASGAAAAIATQQTMQLWSREMQESTRGLQQFTIALTGAIPLMDAAGRIAGAGAGVLGGMGGLAMAGGGAAIGGLVGGPIGIGIGAAAGYVASQTILKPFVDAAQEIMGIISEATAEGLQRGISLALQLGDIRRLMGGAFGGLAGAGAAGGVFGFDLLSSLQGQGAGIYGPMMEARLGMWGVGTGGGMMGALEQMRGVYGGMDPLMRTAMMQSMFGAQGAAAGRMMEAPEDIWQRAMGLGEEREEILGRAGGMFERVGHTQGLLGAQVGNLLLEIGERAGPIAIRVMERLMGYIEERGPMIVDVFERLAHAMERGTIAMTGLFDATLKMFMWATSNPALAAAILGGPLVAFAPLAPAAIYGALKLAGSGGPTTETAGYGAGLPSVRVDLYVREKPEWMLLYAEQVAEQRYREVTRG